MANDWSGTFTNFLQSSFLLTLRWDLVAVMTAQIVRYYIVAKFVDPNFGYTIWANHTVFELLSFNLRISKTEITCDGDRGRFHAIILSTGTFFTWSHYLSQSIIEQVWITDLRSRFYKQNEILNMQKSTLFAKPFDSNVRRPSTIHWEKGFVNVMLSIRFKFFRFKSQQSRQYFYI